MFEDPANQTPFNSEEGGYLYIYGGPYDAWDEIGDEFGGIVSDEVIQRAVSRTEDQGTEWAPGPDHPDHTRAADEYRESIEDNDTDSDRYDLGFDLEEIDTALDQGGKPNYGDDGNDGNGCRSCATSTRWNSSFQRTRSTAAWDTTSPSRFRDFRGGHCRHPRRDRRDKGRIDQG